MNNATKAFCTAIALASVCALAFPDLSRADTPAPAKEVVSKAQAQAAKENKAVLVGFHASWCGWCKKMEKALSDPKLAALMDKYFVTVWIDVLESPEKKSLENAGGEDLMKANGGVNTGIPFLYFTDSDGKTIVNSIRPAAGTDKGGNIGCPYEPEEIAHWMTMVKKASPKMTEDEVAFMKASFEALKKADKKGG